MVASRLALSLLAVAAAQIAQIAQVAQAAQVAQVDEAAQVDELLLKAPGFPPAAVGAWTWTGLPGTRCMNGEETGAWVKYGPNGAAGSELGVYLSGGGACFNLETCLAAAHTAKPGAPANTGIWNAARADNPFANFSWIVVPYCTGDVHIGDRTAREDGALRHYHGKANLQLIMREAVATFNNTEVFVVTGESAGGFGAISAYSLLRSYWPFKHTRGVLLDDSGPVLDDTALAPCLQALWRKTWDLNSTLPARCPCVSDAGGLAGVWNFTRSRWPDDSFGLISSLKDGTISTFFAYGELDCKNTIAPILYDKLQGGLERLAAAGQGRGQGQGQGQRQSEQSEQQQQQQQQLWSLYLMEGDVHTHTGSKDSFYTQRSFGNASLLEWVTTLVKGHTPPTVGPK